MMELYPGFFSMLRLGKSLYENGFLEKNQCLFQEIPLNEDYFYELAYEATSVVFEDTFQDYNEDQMMDTYVFCDPLIDRFCHLCWQYEQRRGLPEEKNPYRRDMERIIYSGFELNGYDYNFDWKLSANDRGRRRLLFFCGPEFYDLEDLPLGLLEIFEGFQEMNLRLEKALNELDAKKVTEKEAA